MNYFNIFFTSFYNSFIPFQIIKKKLENEVKNASSIIL